MFKKQMKFKGLPLFVDVNLTYNDISQQRDAIKRKRKMKQQLYKTARIKAGLSNLIPTDFVDGQYVSVRWVAKAYDGFTQSDQDIYSVCPDTSHDKSKTSFLYESALENFCL